ncbi:MAG: glucose-6-phosphate dehydrogenase [Proteobacteria bacterium]|nr:glucose-6-phosphate dehydrogenase [Pseudomonadota bacterium]
MTNPFQLGGEESLKVDPCVVVIFGATGDLTHRKLVPALYNLAVDSLLPANFHLICFARREYSDEVFRAEMKKAVQEFSRRQPLDEAVWAEFSSHLQYISSAFDNQEGYQNLSKTLDALDTKAGRIFNRVFYLATSPDYFEVISKMLGGSGLLNEYRDGNNSERIRAARVVVEKPFGHDIDSAKQLNKVMLSQMSEQQIYRIDHYLGKETVQNLLVFRFANGIFEPIWNHKYIDHVEISVCESIGVGSRAGYFDKSGILRDIVQNHLFQLLCLVGLEPPVAFEADAVRDEKVKVLKSIRRISQVEIASKVVRGRYLSGSVGGKEVNGYLAEAGVDANSTTETYVAMELAIDNWRWAGVPFFIRAGKRLPKRITDISIHFKQVPHKLFQDQDIRDLTQNILSFQIQPDEGITFKISSKPPGPRVRVQPVNMNFSYGTSFGVSAPEAYERLLLDCMRGDATLFTRDDEIEQAWDILDSTLEAWKPGNPNSPAVFGYEAGTWGPTAADELIQRKAKSGWRRL